MAIGWIGEYANRFSCFSLERVGGSEKKLPVTEPAWWGEPLVTQKTPGPAQSFGRGVSIHINLLKA